MKAKAIIIQFILFYLLAQDLQAEERIIIFNTNTLTTNQVITIKWEPQYYFEVRVSGKGVIVVNKSDNWLSAGTKLVLEAIPNEYHYFNGWKGDIESNDNPLEIVIIKPLPNLIAEFKPYTSSKGTPYEWYVLNGITNHLESADEMDHDNDGFSGRMEYIWGTSPTDNMSYPKISVLRTNDIIKIIIPEARVGRNYFLYETEKLNREWKLKMKMTPESNDDRIEMVLPLNNTGAQYFRVGAELKTSY